MENEDSTPDGKAPRENCLYRQLPDSIVQTYRSCYTDTALQFLAKHPREVYNADEIAAEVGCSNRETIRKGLCRLAKKGIVERTQKGFYRYSSNPKMGVVDMMIHSSRIGIENLRFINRNVRKGGTGAPSDSVPRHGNDTDATPVETGVQTVQTVPGQFPDNYVNMRQGFPIKLRTGQEITWGIDNWGTETIMFKAGGAAPFSIDHIIDYLERFMLEGLGPGWDRVSIEWNFDSKRVLISEPVTFQIAQGELLKFYQHNGVARLEGVSRTVVGFPDTLLALIEVSERGQGSRALKEVEKMKSRLSQVEKDTRMNNNLVYSLSDRVHGIGKKPQRKERPLV